MYCLGASTKGNVLLHQLQLTREKVKAVGEINEDKFGKMTATGNIPIIAEKEVLKRDPRKTTILVLPWHFRVFFVEKLADFVSNGGHVIYPFEN